MSTEISCQFPGCNWQIAHDSEAVAIALLVNHGDSHRHGNGNGGKVKQPKVDRPELSQDISDEDWETFHEEWLRFKRSLYSPSTTQSEVTDQLLQCCQQSL